MKISFAIFIALCGICQVYSENLLDLKDLEELPRCELGGTYNLPHNTYCDRFYICSGGNIYLSQCDDGFAYVPYKGCALLHAVDCSNRPNLQNPKGTGICQRLNGIYKDYESCGQYYRCTNGTAVMENCDPLFVFDDLKKMCREPDDEERRQCFPIEDLFVPPLENIPITFPATEAPISPAPVNPAVPTSPLINTGLGSVTPDEAAKFSCPRNSLYPYGDHARYPYPGNCRFFFLCFMDGSMKVAGCPMGSGYNSLTTNCDQSIKC